MWLKSSFKKEVKQISDIHQNIKSMNKVTKDTSPICALTAKVICSTILINYYSKKVSPVILSGTQFFIGGFVLFLIGNAMGGHLDHVTAGGITVVLYLALVSAVAYTLWSVLLAYNDVSKVAIFGFVNPLCSVILSALVLGEIKQAFNIGSLIALALVCVGIYIVNAKKNNKSNVE